MTTPQQLDRMAGLYLNGVDPRTPLASPLYAELRGLPPLLMQVGDSEVLLAEPHVRPMDFTGRPMRGMVYVGAAGLRTKSQLAKWVERGAQYAESAPGKRKASRKRGQ